jgi:hypothetical protein
MDGCDARLLAPEVVESGIGRDVTRAPAEVNPGITDGIFSHSGRTEHALSGAISLFSPPPGISRK